MEEILFPTTGWMVLKPGTVNNGIFKRTYQLVCRISEPSTVLHFVHGFILFDVIWLKGSYFPRPTGHLTSQKTAFCSNFSSDPNQRIRRAWPAEWRYPKKKIQSTQKNSQENSTTHTFGTYTTPLNFQHLDRYPSAYFRRSCSFPSHFSQTQIEEIWHSRNFPRAWKKEQAYPIRLGIKTTISSQKLAEKMSVKKTANQPYTHHLKKSIEFLEREKKGAWILDPYDGMRKLEVEATQAKDTNLFYVTSCLCCICISSSFPRSGEHKYSTRRCSAHSLPPCHINLAVSSGTSRHRY